MKAIIELMLDKISKEKFLEINEITQIELVVKDGLIEAYKSFDANGVENFIYVIFKYNLYNEEYVKVLNELLISKWHYQHENIVILLQKISAMESISYLNKAIESSPAHYLLKDENYAFEVKCVRAIYHIGKEKSLEYLEKLCKNGNDVIRKAALKQVSKLRQDGDIC